MRKTLIARATGSDGLPSIEVKYEYDRLPTYTDHREAELAIIAAFRELHGRAPVHVGSATLPYIRPNPEGDDSGN